MKTRRTLLRLASVCAAGALVAPLATAPAVADGEVTIYSYRAAPLVKPLSDAFTDQTGVKVMEFPTSDMAQKIYAEQNFEYPVVDDVERAELLKSMGDFTVEDIALADIAQHRAAAI